MLVMSQAQSRPGECTYSPRFGNYCHRPGIPEQEGLCFWHSGLPKTKEQIEAEVKSGNSLEGVVITHLNLAGANLQRAKLRGFGALYCEFDEADLSDARMESANFEGCNFIRSKLSNIFAIGARFAKCIFIEADLSHANLLSADLTNSSFQNANLQGAQLGLAPLILFPGLGNPKQLNTRISGADFDGADFTNIQLPESYLDAPNLQEPLKRVWRASVREQLNQATKAKISASEKKKTLEELAKTILQGIPGLTVGAKDKRRETSEIDLIVENRNQGLMAAGLNGPIFVECRNVSAKNPVDAKSVRDFVGKLPPGVIGLVVTTNRLTRDAQKELGQGTRKGMRLLFWDKSDLEEIADGKANPEQLFISRYHFVLGL